MFGAQSSAFEPTAVRTMADALDEAWAFLEENRDADRDPQETRLALAMCIIDARHRRRLQHQHPS
jgi:hypothetical protein